MARAQFVHLCVALLSMIVTSPSVAAERVLRVPRIVEPWWQVAGDPDLGPWTSPGQQPVDFAIWPAADGTWQLWSCIRATKCGGNGRLLYRWEGNRLTGPNWNPMGVAMTADPKLGETLGGLQAPYVLRASDAYWMFYGDWHAICLARSDDGKKFQRVLNAQGRPQLFTEDISLYANTRDAMVLPIGDVYYGYYTAFPHEKGAVYCRTSKDLRHWSASKVVAFGGSAGNGLYAAECPHVVHHEPSGYYYLFRTQQYGAKAETRVYRSKDPLNFGINDDRLLVAQLPIAAPEILRHDGQWYIAALLPSLKGIRIAKLDWAPAN